MLSRGVRQHIITYCGFQVVNLLPIAEADIGLFLPFIWPRDESKLPLPLQAITWNNGLGGWYSANFDNLGTSLLVTVDIQTTPATSRTRLCLQGKLPTSQESCSDPIPPFSSPHRYPSMAE